MAEAIASTSSNSNNVPKYKDMVITAIIELKERKGSSRTAIVNYISDHYCPNKSKEDIARYVAQALKRAKESEEIVNSTGNGLIGRFKLSAEFLSRQKSKSAKESSAKKKKVKDKEDKKPEDGVKTKSAKDDGKVSGKATKSVKRKAVKVKLDSKSKGGTKSKKEK